MKLTLEAVSKIAADDIHFCLNIFSEKIRLGISSESHEMSSLILSEKKKQQQQIMKNK